MIRYEVKTIHTAFVGCEDTMQEAKAYITALKDDGVEILSVEYYDLDERINFIRTDDYYKSW